MSRTNHATPRTGPAARIKRAAADELVQPASPPWVWLAFSFPFTVALWFDLAGSTGFAARAVCLAFIAAYSLACPLTVYRPLSWRVAACLVVTAINSAHVFAFGHDAMTYSYSIVLMAILLPWHWAALCGGGLALVVVAVLAVRTGGVPTKHMLLLLVALSGMGIGGFFRMAQQLKEANATIAALAVHEDRERIARDLHDALGAGLTTLIVKAGLARRLLESGEPQAATTELREVEELGRRVLDDVRAAVRATGELSMATALADARRALGAAGIGARLPEPADGTPEIFAYVLREGVTNVIRHSSARTCEVRLGPGFIEVRDDGTGSAEPLGRGLSGLATRLGALGGTLSAGSGPAGGYLLRAELPS
ncbi:histidine kinase [Nonomuraea sp. NPDC050310]|uniref:sensor histidine kinase n=1 Tax=unclassified Nonomuraea TaxID=2593643 RepID=UPI0033FD261B